MTGLRTGAGVNLRTKLLVSQAGLGRDVVMAKVVTMHGAELRMSGVQLTGFSQGWAGQAALHSLASASSKLSHDSLGLSHPSLTSLLGRTSLQRSLRGFGIEAHNILLQNAPAISQVAPYLSEISAFIFAVFTCGISGLLTSALLPMGSVDISKLISEADKLFESTDCALYNVRPMYEAILDTYRKHLTPAQLFHIEYKLFQIYINYKSYEKALALGSAILLKLPEGFQSAEVYIGLGRACFYEHQQQKGVMILEQALERGIDSDELHFWLGHNYQKMRYLSKALEHYRLAVDLDPYIHFHIAEILHILGQKEEAIKHYRLLLAGKVNPQGKRSEVLNRLGLLLVEDSRTVDEGINLLGDASKFEAERYSFDYAVALFNAERYAEALAVLDEIILWRRSNYSVQSLRSQCSKKMGLKGSLPVSRVGGQALTGPKLYRRGFVIKIDGVNYTILEEIGRGGFGIVYLVMDFSGKKFALKVFDNVHLLVKGHFSFLLTIIFANNKLLKKMTDACSLPAGVCPVYKVKEMFGSLFVLKKYVPVPKGNIAINGNTHDIFSLFDLMLLLHSKEALGKFSPAKIRDIFVNVLDVYLGLLDKGIYPVDIKAEDILFDGVDGGQSLLSVDLDLMYSSMIEPLIRRESYTIGTPESFPPERLIMRKYRPSEADVVWQVGSMFWSLVSSKGIRRITKRHQHQISPYIAIYGVTQLFESHIPDRYRPFIPILSRATDPDLEHRLTLRQLRQSLVELEF